MVPEQLPSAPAKLSVGKVFQAYGDAFRQRYGESMPKHHKRALRALALCRTAALGGHVLECTECGHRVEQYNSCRSRGCPQCEGGKEAAWLQERAAELLPTAYFHVVFTIPHVLNELVRSNERVVYGLLFGAASKALTVVARRKFGGTLGFFAVLHTWGQLLDLHPHLHCVVPGGVVQDDGTWVAASQCGRYLLPEKALLAVFRGVFLRSLRAAHATGTLTYAGDFEQLLAHAAARRWTMHTEPPFGSPMQVLKYLARYTRKVAIGNSRLVSLEDRGMLSFSFKDYADHCASKLCRLHAVEFIRRFLMHIPQPGFVRIRYYGFMAGKNRKARIASLKEQIAGLLPVNRPPTLPSVDCSGALATASTTPRTCPACKATAALQVVRQIAPVTTRRLPPREDSS